MANSPLRVRIAPGGEPADPDTWDFVDVTDRVVEPVVISRGRSSESDTAGPTNVTLTLRNDDGALSPQNPLGPWYGLLGLNTPLEVAWDGTERAVVFLSELPTTWPGVVEVSRVPVRADGLFRRLGQGAPELESALTRATSRRNDVVAYWPLEDERGSSQAMSPFDGVPPIRPSGVEFGAGEDVPPGSAPGLVRIGEGAGGVLGAVPAHPFASEYVVSELFRIDELDGTQRDILNVYTSGRAVRWRLSVNSSSVLLRALDSAESLLVNASSSITASLLAGRWLLVRLRLQQSGSATFWTWEIAQVADRAVLELYTAAATLSSSQLGQVTRVGAGPGLAGAGAPDRHVGHITVFRRLNGAVPVDADAVVGYNGERAADRFVRLCAEEGLVCQVVGDPTLSMPMGPQRPDSLVGQLREIEATDGGTLGDVGQLEYRIRASRYNQDPALELGETDVLASPESTDDDRHIRNDVTASARGGSSARFVDADSVRNFGTYNTTLNANPARDSLLALLAAWAVHLGTTEDMRWPRIPVSVLKNPDLVDEWLALRPGDRLTAHNCFPQLPGVDVDVLVEGWAETLRTDNVRLDLNCSPARPWNVWQLEHATFGRVWSPRAYLAEDVDDEATSFDVVVPVRRPLNPASDFEEPITTGANVFFDWSEFGGTFERSREQAFTGRWSGKLTPDGVSLEPVVASTSGPAAPSRTYRGDMWLYSPVGGFSVRHGIRFLRPGNPLPLTVQNVLSSPVAIPAGEWVRVSIGAAAPALTTSVLLFVEFVGTPSAADVIYVDDAEVGVPGGAFTTDSGDYPQLARIGGEVVRVTAMGAASAGVQSATVERGVNGVVKPHPAGTRFELYPKHVISL